MHGPAPRARRPLEPGSADPGDPGPGGLLRGGLFAGPGLDPRLAAPVDASLVLPPAERAEGIHVEGGEGGGRRGHDRPRPAGRSGRGRAARAVAGLSRGSPAFVPTLLAAARRGGPPLCVLPEDLHRWLRTVRPGRLLLLGVDGSGSMGGEHLELGRALAHGLLRDAYLRRDRVAMIAFRGTEAALLFGPTTQQELVERALAALPVGGTTPLAAALELCLGTLARARRDAPEGRAALVLLTDGRANVQRSGEAGGGRVLDEVEALCVGLASVPRLDRLVVDATEAGKDDRPARALAGWLGARRVPLARLGLASADPAALLADLLVS